MSEITREQMMTYATEGLKEENTTLRARVEELESKLSDLTTRHEELEIGATLERSTHKNTRDLLTAARKRIEELEGENARLKESEAVLLSTTDRQETAGKRIEELEGDLRLKTEAFDAAIEAIGRFSKRIQELEATCAAQREALEAYEKVEIEREKCRAGRAHINAALKWDRLRKKALSPTAGSELLAQLAAQREALREASIYESDHGLCWCMDAGCLRVDGPQPRCARLNSILSPTAGRDYRDAVLEEAAKMFEGSSRGVILLGHQAAAYIRLLKRGGK